MTSTAATSRPPVHAGPGEGGEVHSRLAHFPVVLFAVVMGTAGLALAVARLEDDLGRAPVAGAAVAALAAVLLVLVAAVYGLKAIRHPSMVAAEWNHPVRIAFFPAAAVSAILVATAVQGVLPGPAFVLWSVGSLAMLASTLAVVSAWISHRPFEPHVLTPAWFIPAVGNVVVPLAGTTFGMTEVSWFFFAVGMVFWLILLTLVFNRLIFHTPLPDRLMPTLTILVAPPAVAFLAWTKLAGGLDPFGRVLYYAAVLFALVVATQAGRLAKVSFTLSWWAYSFPLAAFTVATFAYAEAAGSPAHAVAARGLAVLTVVTVGALAVRTATAARAGTICVPE